MSYLSISAMAWASEIYPSVEMGIQMKLEVSREGSHIYDQREKGVNACVNEVGSEDRLVVCSFRVGPHQSC